MNPKIALKDSGFQLTITKFKLSNFYFNFQVKSNYLFLTKIIFKRPNFGFIAK